MALELRRSRLVDGVVTLERWRRLRAAIETALEVPPEIRDAVLAEALSDDPSLLSEARSMMRAAIEAALEALPESRDAMLAKALAGDPSLLSEARSILRAAEETGLNSPTFSRSNVDLLALDQALDELAVQDHAQARLVKLRYFGGLTFEQLAQTLDISASAAKRAWGSARLWLNWRLRSRAQRSWAES